MSKLKNGEKYKRQIFTKRKYFTNILIEDFLLFVDYFMKGLCAIKSVRHINLSEFSI